MQKYVDDHNNQDHGLDQSLINVVNAFRDSGGRIKCAIVLQPGRKTLFQLFHQFTDTFDRLNGIGSGQLIKTKNGGWFTVDPAVLRISLSAEFDPGDILDPDVRAADISSQDDLRKVIFGNHPSPRPYSLLAGPTPRHRSPPDL